MRFLQNAGLLFLTASLASAGCFHGGREGDAQVVRDNIAAVCNNIKGFFVNGGSRSACIKDGNNQYYIQIQNKNSKGVTVDFATCKAGILRQSNACGHGGEQETNGIYYKADPNDGLCIDAIYIDNNGIESKFRRVKRKVQIAYDVGKTSAHESG